MVSADIILLKHPSQTISGYPQSPETVLASEMIPQTDLFYCIRINSPSLNNTTKNIRDLDK